MEPKFKKISKDELAKMIKELRIDEEFSVVITDEWTEPLYIGIKRINTFDIDSIITGIYGSGRIICYSAEIDYIDEEIEDLIDNILLESDGNVEQLHIQEL